ncbi:aminopeptidase P family protein [Anaerobaca lacustris]|uniref:Xaa-Pro aminopeptidase n=1 Tax=Anaerobaca lacustris TaxID=3044600 RepID=A0AAW6TW67_9BACT|nr:Xaa-Pro aminopeptidase [Sedimentisphaerales bacterium M17dextr]
MFPPETYKQRRAGLRRQISSGVVLFAGNEPSPMNYADNCYPFRQDSSFLYYFGLDEPALAAVIDVDEGTECLFGDDATVDDVIWTGPQTPLCEKAHQVGITQTAPSRNLPSFLRKASDHGRPIHLLPPCRDDQILKIGRLLDIPPQAVGARVSESLIRAVVAQRSVKAPEEIEQIELAMSVSHQMQVTAMKTARPGVVEREVVGVMAGIARSRGVRFAFEPIFSIHGETLHNPFHNNVMKAGDVAVNDSGAESPLRYASDVTRTIPVGGRFTQNQREVYSIVLNAQEAAIAAIRPGVEFRDIHRLACLRLVAGLKELGLTKGDPAEAVAAGAHTLFFQCGLGHMMGLDVHDMEGLGEDYVGYTDTIRRNPAFGWRSLRLAKAVEPGHVVTVEPGIYLIPTLIDRWKAERKCEAFINYDKVETYRDFGGVRIEDDVLVTDTGARVLGPPIPKTIAEVETLASA